MTERLDTGQFRDGTNISRVLVRMADFFCQGCQAWTSHVPYTDDELELLHEPGAVVPACVRCHEDFQCGECGDVIDQNGVCQRDDPEGKCPSKTAGG